MKKSLISLAVAAGMTASGVANAAPTVYGFLDLSLVDQDSAPEIELVSYTSAFGIKGSEDLGDGLKAIYKVEFQFNAADRENDGDSAQILDRDQWVGLKGGFGSVKLGTMSSNYKQMGGKIDPFYRTVIEARAVGQQSRLHSGATIDGGRMTHAIQYASPKMGGIQVVANATFAGVPDEATGLGIRYATKELTVWFDLLNTTGNRGANDETATKIGAKFKATKELTLGAQLEQTEDTNGADVMFLSATYGLDKSNTVAFTYGVTDDVVSGFNLGLWHKLSKMTSAYVAYNDTSDESPGGGSAADDDTLVVGLRKKF